MKMSSISIELQSELAAVRLHFCSEARYSAGERTGTPEGTAILHSGADAASSMGGFPYSGGES